MDLSLLGLMLLGLVIVTVVIELLVEHLEESLGGVGKVLKEKVFKECALLGIVSFAALVSIHLPISMNHNIFLVFELAHVLMFAMALVFSTLVGFISYFLRMISNRWAAADQHEPDDLYRLWCRSLEKLGSASGANVLFGDFGCVQDHWVDRRPAVARRRGVVVGCVARRRGRLAAPRRLGRRRRLESMRARARVAADVAAAAAARGAVQGAQVPVPQAATCRATEEALLRLPPPRAREARGGARRHPPLLVGRLLAHAARLLLARRLVLGDDRRRRCERWPAVGSTLLERGGRLPRAAVAPRALTFLLAWRANTMYHERLHHVYDEHFESFFRSHVTAERIALADSLPMWHRRTLYMLYAFHRTAGEGPPAPALKPPAGAYGTATPTRNLASVTTTNSSNGSPRMAAPPAAAVSQVWRRRCRRSEAASPARRRRRHARRRRRSRASG